MLDDRIKEIAEKFIAAGFWVIPLRNDGSGKGALVDWQVDTIPRITKWDFTGANIALITGAETGGYVVVDCDNSESYKNWLAHRPRTPLRVKSPRGMHFYYRHPGGYIKSNSHIKAAEGFEYDVKGDRSICVAPPSMKGGRQYQVCVCTGNLEAKWIRPEKLPPFDPAWRPETPFRSAVYHSEGIKDVRKYLAMITVVEGERDKKTYRAAKLCLENKITEAEAIAVVTEWHQTNVNPPWDPMEIIEKVRRVYSGR